MNVFVKNWPPRWRCGVWEEWEGWLHILSDSIIFVCYITIPLVIIHWMVNTKRISKWAGALFACFIFLCGVTHLNEVIVFWHPRYRFFGVVKALTALASIGTVAYLTPALMKWQEMDAQLPKDKVI